MKVVYRARYAFFSTAPPPPLHDLCERKHANTLSRVRNVTKDGFWIDDFSQCTLKTRNYFHCSTHFTTHYRARKIFSVS
jgi:hypothetical protein